jgi:hypothetical protein
MRFSALGIFMSEPEAKHEILKVPKVYAESDEVPIILERVLNDLWALRDLEENWDSYGGRPPTSTALRLATRLIRTVEALYQGRAGERVSPYDVAPIPRGGVQIEWRGDDLHLEVEIGPVGDCAYLLKRLTPSGRQYEEAHNVTWADLKRQLDRVLLS